MNRRFNIGIDCDGVLADFTLKFTTLLKEMFPHLPFEPFGEDFPRTSWDFASDPGLGIRREYEAGAWRRIKETEGWWEEMPFLLSTNARLTLLRVANRHNVYVITSRVQTEGSSLVRQTMTWLQDYLGLEHAAVIIAREKGPVAKALKLDWFLDDKPQNCQDVAEMTEDCRVFLKSAPYNLNFADYRIGRVEDLEMFLRLIESAEANR